MGRCVNNHEPPCTQRKMKDTSTLKYSILKLQNIINLLYWFTEAFLIQLILIGEKAQKPLNSNIKKLQKLISSSTRKNKTKKTEKIKNTKKHSLHDVIKVSAGSDI